MQTGTLPASAPQHLVGPGVAPNESERKPAGNLVNAQVRKPAPRARGDGPGGPIPPSATRHCSPRTRGWSPGASHRRAGRGLLPAHAGMVPGRSWWKARRTPAPRARGDGPDCRAGSTPSGSCSPRTRGWSRPGKRHRHHHVLLPAHAGMVPGWRRSGGVRGTAPRARGDGPPHPAPPTPGRRSPRTRGWSQVGYEVEDDQRLLPAHAGMVPASGHPPPHAEAAPRARGDGPGHTLSDQRRRVCSPRTRGWSVIDVPRMRRIVLLPAHAGMVPGGSPTAT